MFRKSNVVLTNNAYKHPKTNLLTFQFEPSDLKFNHLHVQHSSLEGKDIYAIDHFFTDSDAHEMREAVRSSTFSRPSYGSPEAIERGEKPARSMNGKERWTFFSNPPGPVQKIYRLFGALSAALDAEISTLPWELCDGPNSSPSVIANLLEEATEESMQWGKHRDSDPEKGLAFGVPVLYAENGIHPPCFKNGKEGNPWMLSAMLYVTDESFLPEYRLGTSFFHNDGRFALTTDCLNMRLVLFESDILHSIEASQIPTSVKTWRVSYVFKLMVNPRHNGQDLKQGLIKLLQPLPGCTNSSCRNHS